MNSITGTFSSSTYDNSACSPELSFRQISSFGASTIRRFTHNVADMKKLAARDFEDILQVSSRRPVLTLHHSLHFSAASLALKGYCRHHMTTQFRVFCTLRRIGTPLPSCGFIPRQRSMSSILDHVTVLFAKALRHFKHVICPCFNTVETDREYKARRRAAEQRMSRKCASNVQSTSEGGKRPKTFNLLTSKFHALGDYVNMIKMFGTTDSYSTQIVRISMTGHLCII